MLAAGSIILVVYQSFGDGEKVIPSVAFMQREVSIEVLVGFCFGFGFESHFYMFISALADLRDYKVLSSVTTRIGPHSQHKG